MKLGKKKQPENAEPQKPASPKATAPIAGDENVIKKEARKSFYNMLGMLTLLTAAMTAALYFLFVIQINNNFTDKLSSELAKAQASSLQTHIRILSAHMQDMAASTNIVSALDQRNYPEALLQAEKLQSEMPYAEKVFIIPAGLADDFILSFSELSMVRKIERKETFIPEAIERDGTWFLNMATPIMSEQSFKAIAGTLFISYRIDLLKQPLLSLDPEMGDTTLIQQFPGGEARVVLTTGKAKPENNLKSGVNASVADSHWTVLLTPSPKLKHMSVSSPMVLAASIALYLIILMVILQRFFQQLSSKLRTEVAPIQIASAKSISKVEKIEKSIEEEAEEELKRRQKLEDASIASPIFQHNDMLDVAETEDSAELDDMEDLSDILNLDDSLPEEFDSGDIFSMEASDSTATANTPAAEKSEKIAPAAPAAPAPASRQGRSINPTIFRDYDIRGNADRFIGNDDAYAIGQAIGSEALSKGEKVIAVGGDGRLSTPRIKEHLIKGIISTGCDVEDIGKVTTPLMYFTTTTTTTMSGVMVTASHNPAEDNGFKIVICGRTLASNDIQNIRQRIESGNINSGSGTLKTLNINSAYMDQIAADIALSGNLKVVIDCANGIAGDFAPKLLEELGCEVVPLYCTVDGSFPNHDPDPSLLSNLDDLVEKVKAENADLGIALDGDGDRIV
ncbi:MAG: hypothetical protein KDI30_10705, partial [Pseudomonadales bacterium]|nr:hypothetical protein [Pseudomonadales bacterium]